MNIVDKVWSAAHKDTKNHFRQMWIDEHKFTSYFYSTSKNNLSDILELDKITQDIPWLDESKIPKSLNFPSPYYDEESLLIGEVSLI